MEPFTDFQELASTKRHQADLGALGLVVITDPMACRRLFSLTPMAVSIQNLIRVTKRDKCATATRDARIADSVPACAALGV